MRILILASLAFATTGQFFLLSTQRTLGHFSALLFGAFILAAAIYGWRVSKIEKDDEIPARFPKDLILKFSPTGLLLLFTSIVLMSALVFTYSIYGYHHLLLFGWLTAVTAALAAFWPLHQRTPQHPYIKADFIILAAILALFAPIYLFKLHQIPWQVNTDEITISYFAKQIASDPKSDLFGPSSYFGFPSLIFFIWGKLAGILGGVNLANVRLLHATSGLLIVASGYFFFRLFFKTPQAIAATFILGSNHALVAISRMAMRDNTSLLVVIIALIFLFRGLASKCPLKIFIGSLFSGLAFYTYFPARATPILWFLFVGLAYVYFVHKVKLSTVFKIIIISAFGLFLSASPILVGSFKDKTSGLSYSKETTLVFAEGRNLARIWVSAPDVKTAVKENIYRGILTFNSNKNDEGWIYPNLGHGFVDPVTGLLIWLGFFRIAFKRRKDLEDVLIASSFIALWLAFSFLVNKAPSYTRLLVVLPFVAFLATEGASSLARLPSKVMALTAKRQIFILGLGTLAIVIFNLWIFADFVRSGFREGNDVGGIGRYIEKKAEKDAEHKFYVIANNNYPVYSWGASSQWQMWAGFFAGINEVKVLGAHDIHPALLTNYNFSIILNNQLYQTEKANLQLDYPRRKIHPIKPDGSILAVEIE